MEDQILYLQLGRNITSANDPLKKISIVEFSKLIRQPDTDLASKIQQLRTVQSIDKKRYHALKRMLPYVTCGIFNPPYRRTINFASIICFIVDIDHLSEKGIDLQTLFEKLKTDDRIHLMFVSPGNDGLKLVFYLNQKCFDSAKYSMFYKLFIMRFSQEYNLEQSVDKVTSDVTRACFLSADENAWFNPFAMPVSMDAYIDFDDHNSLCQANEEVEKAIETTEQKGNDDEKAFRQELPEDVLQQIKEKLNPNIRTKIEKKIFVPEEVIAVVDKVEEKMQAFGIHTKQVESIHYGKKFVFGLDNNWAQLNLFFGKKGFKIVKTPASGSNNELAEIAFKILCEMFYNA
jgi:hypothetical protein